MKKIIIFDNQETNYEVSSEGKIYNRITGKELKGTIARNEYCSVQLVINGKPKTFMIHRLVAEAFTENPNHYSIVDHINRNKLDNNASNLRWVDSSTNAKNCERKNRSKIAYLQGDIDDNWVPVSKDSDYCVNKNGQILNKKTKRLLQGSQRNGYIRINCNGRYKSLHRLVWEAFYGEIPEGKLIDHIDGNRANNSLDNLRLVTQSENMLNAQKNGHKGQVKISQYDLEGNFIQKYSSIREAALTINGSECAIKDAANRMGTSSGYFWIREDQNITIEEVLKNTKANKPKSTAIGVSQYSPEGKFIKHYSSCGEAMRETNINHSTIVRAAKAKRLGKNFYWILDNQTLTINDLL
jgi:hypothetical protein